MKGINLSENEQATQAIAPQISPAGGSYIILDKPLVTLGSAIQSANIYYTLDGYHTYNGLIALQYPVGYQ